MFIKSKKSGYTRGESVFCQGMFLLFLQPDTGNVTADCAMPIRCLVRYTSMSQMGNFMMGCVRILGKSYSVSGSYGSDGLPMGVPQEVYDLGTELPAELREAWNNGGGWNGAGSEADAVREWALKTFGVK